MHGSNRGVCGRMRTGDTPEHDLHEGDGAVADDSGGESCIRVAASGVPKTARRDDQRADGMARREVARRGLKAHRRRTWRRPTPPKRKVKMNWTILPKTAEW